MKENTMPENDILTGLAEIVNDITGIKTEQIVTSASFVDDLDIDSLSMVEVAVAAEEKFGVRIPDETLAKLKTVGDAVSFIANAGVPA
jgi:acyl carrier protein